MARRIVVRALFTNRKLPRWLPIFLLGAGTLLAACQPAPLEGKSCPCNGAGGYVCCEPTQMCLSPQQICIQRLGDWPASPAPPTPLPDHPSAVNDMTVFAFSQVAVGDQDPQVLTVKPDLVIRAFGQWDNSGITALEYDPTYADACHAQNIHLDGGLPASAIFMGQSGFDFDAVATTDATGAQVPHPTANLSGYLYRGTLANPAYREHLVNMGKLQIDAGVDGFDFQEVNLVYQGSNDRYDGNEGFDDYHLADFNAYLLAKYPTLNEADLRTRFDMDSSNVLRPDVPAWDLRRNFDYRKYLSTHGWSSAPLAPDNPLAPEWGTVVANRPTPGSQDFANTAEAYRYLPQIVSQLRAYAQTTRPDTPLLISADGIYPFVDFQSVGLYDYNHDNGKFGPTEHVQYLPLVDGHLDGHASLQGDFIYLRQRSEAIAPGVPVVVFLDAWWAEYRALTAQERQDYWRLYVAEAYANGLFFAFHLQSEGVPAAPRASDDGTLDLITQLAGWYRAHKALYHGVTPSTATATTSQGADAMVAVSDRWSSDGSGALVQRIVHVVNHAYDPSAGLVEVAALEVDVDSTGPIDDIRLVSPDWDDRPNVPPTIADGRVAVTISTLDAYAAVVITYAR
jgi:hypothetical protein